VAADRKQNIQCLGPGHLKDTQGPRTKIPDTETNLSTENADDDNNDYFSDENQT